LKIESCPKMGIAAIIESILGFVAESAAADHVPRPRPCHAPRPQGTRLDSHYVFNMF